MDVMLVTNTNTEFNSLTLKFDEDELNEAPAV